MRFPGRNNTSRNSTFEKEGEIASLFLWIFHKNLWRANIFLVFAYYSFWFLPTFCGFLQVFFFGKNSEFWKIFGVNCGSFFCVAVFLAWILAKKKQCQNCKIGKNIKKDRYSQQKEFVEKKLILCTRTIKNLSLNFSSVCWSCW